MAFRLNQVLYILRETTEEVNMSKLFTRPVA